MTSAIRFLKEVRTHFKSGQMSWALFAVRDDVLGGTRIEGKTRLRIRLQNEEKGEGKGKMICNQNFGLIQTRKRIETMLERN